ADDESYGRSRKEPASPVGRDDEPYSGEYGGRPRELKKPDRDDAVAAAELDPREESVTRVGFEIEPGEHFSGPYELEDIVSPYMNKTLATYTPEGSRDALLEMLLDDLEADDQTRKPIVVQVEFRTLPLKTSGITKDTAVRIRTAIQSFKPRTLFSSG